MADTLPHGLVSNTDCVSSDLKSADHVEIEDVAKLWRGMPYISAMDAADVLIASSSVYNQQNHPKARGRSTARESLLEDMEQWAHQF